jgi:hypothetical protein
VFFERPCYLEQETTPRKGCVIYSQFILLPQKVAFIQRKNKKKKDKLSIFYILSLPTPSTPQHPGIKSWIGLGVRTASPR